MFNRIMVCLDGSSLSEQILPIVTEVAQRFGSAVTLFASVEIPTPASPEFPVELDLIQDLRRSEAQQYLDGVAAQLSEAGITTLTATAIGSPGPAIVEYALANAMELIALGTHGRKNIGRLVFGSVTDHVLRHASIPVLAVKPALRPD